jgi:hypothetical protein
MVQRKTREIMLGGIRRYAEKYGVTDLECQIQILPLNQGVFYKMCKNWNAVERVEFVQIMGKKIDLLGFEALSAPFMRNSLEKFSEELSTDLEETSVMLAIHPKNPNEIVLAVYEGKKPLKTLTLATHFTNMGM